MIYDSGETLDSRFHDSFFLGDLNLKDEASFLKKISPNSTLLNLHLENLGQVIRARLRGDLQAQILTDAYLRSQARKEIDEMILEEARKAVVSHFLSIE